jgi:phage terminase large subunit-like protein
MRPLRILCAREFQNSIAASVRQLLVDQIEMLGVSDNFHAQKDEIVCLGTGSTFNFEGLRNNVTRIKSYEGVDIAWIEEAQTISKESLKILIPTIRKKGSELWLTFNPDLEEDEVWRMFLVWTRANALVIPMNFFDNPWFPEELRDEMEVLKARDYEAYENVWLGKCRKQVKNALWKKEIFEAQREFPPLLEDDFATYLATFARIVVAVDPSGCEGEEDERSDEIGIVVAGLGHDGAGRVLQDASGHYSPGGWAAKAVEMFDRWNADTIIAEKNFGGAMVEFTIRTVRKNAPIKVITASRGKVQRAEPVAALYSQGKVHHVGVSLAKLERQMCLFASSGYSGAKSPDRADAAIWALTDLMLDPSPAPNIRFPGGR